MASIKGGEVWYQVSLKGLPQATSGFQALAGVAATAMSAVAGVVAAASAAVIAFYREAAKLAQVQIEAELKLANALRNAGVYSEAFNKELQGVAASIQLATRYGDEELLPVMAAFVRAGITSRKELERMTKLTADFAEATGRDLLSSQRALMMALSGNAAMLKRYGIFIDDATLKSKDHAQILAAIERQIGGMAETMGNTFGGKLKQISNLINDIKENMGKALTLSPEVLKGLDYIKEALRLINRELVETGGLSGVFDTMGRSIMSLVNSVIGLAEGLIKLGRITHTMQRFNPVYLAQLKTMGTTWEKQLETIDELDKSLDDIQAGLEEYADTQEKASALMKQYNDWLALSKTSLVDQAKVQENLNRIATEYYALTGRQINATKAQAVSLTELESAATEAAGGVSDLYDVFDDLTLQLRETEASKMFSDMAMGLEVVNETSQAVIDTISDYVPQTRQAAEATTAWGGAVSDAAHAVSTALASAIEGQSDWARSLAQTLAGIGANMIPGIGQYLAPIAGAFSGKLWDWLFGGGPRTDIDYTQNIIINIGEGMISEKAFWDNLVHYYILPGLKRGGLVAEPVGGAG